MRLLRLRRVFLKICCQRRNDGVVEARTSDSGLLQGIKRYAASDMVIYQNSEIECPSDINRCFSQRASHGSLDQRASGSIHTVLYHYGISSQ